MASSRLRHGCGWALRVVVVVVFVVVAAGCDWPTFHGGFARTGYDAFESKIGAGNVDSLTRAWTASVAGVASSPVVAAGMVFVSSGTVFGPPSKPALFAFSATGTSNCSGAEKRCTPVWEAAPLCPTGCNEPTGTTFSEPTVANGVLYVGDYPDGVVYAFDAAGVTDCSGTPKLCSPLWTARTGMPGTNYSPAVVNGVLYDASSDGHLYAFDAAGTTNCSGTPKVCTPLWTASIGSAGNNASSPAVVNGVLYVAGNRPGQNVLLAFDAAGSIGCAGTPKVCTPLWSAPLAGPIGLAPAVANGTVYVGESEPNFLGQVAAFDAAGSKQCSGTPKTCSPLWTSPTVATITSSPAVANGVLYIGSDDGKLYAFDAAGVANCSGVPTTCAPLWSTGSYSMITASPAVANGVVYVGAWNNNFYAFDAGGAIDCVGTPKTCTPLWTDATGGPNAWSPAIANGVVYNASDDGNLYAYSPGPPPATH